jgi:hypothetical protein
MYKHCHGKATPLYSAEEQSHEGAVGRVMTFLHERHRKAFQAAFDDELQALMPANADRELDDDASRMLTINIGERLLAEGDIHVRGEWREISAHVLGPDGPRLSSGQRRWIEQLEIGRASCRERV